jgi:hypothetical protein
VFSGFQPTSTAKIPTPAPSQSPPLLGTEAALKYAQDPQNAEKPFVSFFLPSICLPEPGAKLDSVPWSFRTIKLFDEFSQKGRIGVITGMFPCLPAPSFRPSLTYNALLHAGGASGLGLEMCLALCEAGGTVYALDLRSSSFSLHLSPLALRLTTSTDII